MKILFLDFDGVWRATGAAQMLGGIIDKQAIALIEMALDYSNQTSETKVVVTSTHRVGVNISEMLSFLEDSGAKVIASSLHEDWKTKVGEEHPFGRRKEINEWLSRHPEVERHVIVDDDFEDLIFDIQNTGNAFDFVHIDSFNGFTFRDAIRVMCLLGVKEIPNREAAKDFVRIGRKF